MSFTEFELLSYLRDNYQEKGEYNDLKILKTFKSENNSHFIFHLVEIKKNITNDNYYNIHGYTTELIQSNSINIIDYFKEILFNKSVLFNKFGEKQVFSDIDEYKEFFDKTIYIHGAFDLKNNLPDDCHEFINDNTINLDCFNDSILLDSFESINIKNIPLVQTCYNIIAERILDDECKIFTFKNNIPKYILYYF